MIPILTSHFAIWTYCGLRSESWNDQIAIATVGIIMLISSIVLLNYSKDKIMRSILAVTAMLSAPITAIGLYLVIKTINTPQPTECSHTNYGQTIMALTKDTLIIVAILILATFGFMKLMQWASKTGPKIGKR